MQFTVEQAAYHRNGVSGEGFYTGIAWCDVHGSGHARRMLVTFFPHYDKKGEPLPAGKGKGGKFRNGRVAVLELNLLPDVAFGTNSWRGDDFYDVADAIVAKVLA